MPANINRLRYAENIIFNNLQQTQIMNYLALKANPSYLSALQNTPFNSFSVQQGMKSSQKVLLLFTISQALNVSLKNYQQQHAKSHQADYQPHRKSFSNKEEYPTPERVIENIISEDQGKNLKPKTKHPIDKLTSLSPLLADPTINHVTQLPTDDENIAESKPDLHKIHHNPISINRSRHQYKKNTFSVSVPQVDLIQSAYLPERGLSAQILAHKRQLLMNRTVESWSNSAKLKKQKREIRNLGN